MKKLIFITAPLFVFSACKYTESPSAALAKEMCSCLFVSEQTVDYCKIVTKESRILAKWEAFPEEQKVIARGVNYTSMAKMDEDPRYGCTLLSVERAPENAALFED